MTTQSKIDTEMDALTILAKLLEYHEGCVWTLRIFSQFLSWELSRVEPAMKWLIDREFAAKNLGSYVRTELGREYYGGAITKAAFQVSTTSWKTEAITKVKQTITNRTHPDWQRSDIENAVIPRPETGAPTCDTTPEDIYLQGEEAERMRAWQKQAAKMLGLTLREFKRLFKADLIKLCTGGGKPHIGRFHRKGSGTQNTCADCVKRRGK